MKSQKPNPKKPWILAQNKVLIKPKHEKNNKNN
jgi:hypothetical protein